MASGTYLKKTWRAGATIEVQKTYSARYGRHDGHAERINRSPDAVARYNRKMAMRELIRIVNANFGPDDIHVVLTYRKNERPDLETAKKDCAKYIRTLRRLCKKQGVDLKYIKSTAIGSKGAVHHHLLVNIADARLLQQLWPHGSARSSFLWPDGEYSRLAAYFAGQQDKEPERIREGCQNQKRWTGSRNLIRPKAKIEEVKASSWKEEPTPVKGFYIDKDSVEAAISPVTGMPYLFYRMIRLPDRGGGTPRGHSGKSGGPEKTIGIFRKRRL